MNKLITVAQIVGWSPAPCADYTEARIREIIGVGKTPLEILELNIPPEDRIWVLLHPDVMTPENITHFVCDCAERGLQQEAAVGREPDPVSWKVVTVARQFADHKTSHVDLENACLAASEIYTRLHAQDSVPLVAASATCLAAYTAYGAGSTAKTVFFQGRNITLIAWVTLHLVGIAAGRRAADAAADGDANEGAWQLKRLRHYILLERN